MASCGARPSAIKTARPGCSFQLKEYKTPFTCCVCLIDGYDTERHRCDHCDRACHRGCLELDEQIQLGNVLGGREFTLFDKPRIAGNSKNGKWAKYCVVCGMVTKHYSYHHWDETKRKDLNVHPYCAQLATSYGTVNCRWPLTAKERVCVLCGEKLPKEASPHGPANFFCWSYQLDGGHHIHVHCYSKVVIQALKSTIPSDDNDNELKIVLGRRKEGTKINWDKLATAVIKVAIDQLTGGIPILEWID